MWIKFTTVGYTIFFSTFYFYTKKFRALMTLYNYKSPNRNNLFIKKLNIKWKILIWKTEEMYNTSYNQIITLQKYAYIYKQSNIRRNIFLHYFSNIFQIIKCDPYTGPASHPELAVVHKKIKNLINKSAKEV